MSKLGIILAAAIATWLPSAAVAQSTGPGQTSGLGQAMQYDLAALTDQQKVQQQDQQQVQAIVNNSDGAVLYGVALPAVQTSLMAPQSVSGANIPSGTWAFGFPVNGAAPYCGAYASQPALGGTVPQVSTTSTDVNICDGVGYDGSAAGGGTGASAGSAAGSNSGSDSDSGSSSDSAAGSGSSSSSRSGTGFNSSTGSGSSTAPAAVAPSF